MTKKIIEKIENDQLKEQPEFRTGDTVVIKVKVTEGQRTRLQAFEGLVISKKNFKWSRS
jgi:large subunit ribosomal protein L19